MRPLPKLGVGLAYQAPLRPLFEARDAPLDYAEVVPDIFWTDRGPGAVPRHLDDPAGLRAVRALRRARPLVPHSIGLSIGSADAFDTAHVAQLRRWWRRHRFPWHSDHLAFHLADHGGIRANAGITLPLARDRETLDLLIPRIAHVRRAVPAPFLLENNVYYFDIPDPQMDEAQFLNALCAESGCGLLLDLHNLHTNCRNHGGDPFAFLAALDLDHVGELHVAGGMELDGFYLDAHSDVIPDEVWRLLAWTLPRCRNVGGVTFELFGSWVDDVGLDAVRDQLLRLRAAWDAAQPAPQARDARSGATRTRLAQAA